MEHMLLAGWPEYFIIYVSKATVVVDLLLSSSAQETATLPEQSIWADDINKSQPMVCWIEKIAKLLLICPSHHAHGNSAVSLNIEHGPANYIFASQTNEGRSLPKMESTVRIALHVI